MSEADLGMTEKRFQQLVNDTFRRHGWLVYHPLRSKGSEPGYPDNTMVRGGVLVFAELKTERGKASGHQARWLKALEGVSGGTPRVVTRLWRPSDWPEILATAKGEKR